MERVVAHRRAGGAGFLPKSPIHGEPLLEDRSPFLGQVGSRFDLEPRSPGDGAIGRQRLQGLDRHAVPHEARVLRGKRLVGDPIRHGQASASPQDAECLRKCLRMIGDMAERFLAHHDVHALVCQRHVHHVALPDAGTVLQTNQCDEFLRGGDTRRCQFDTGHVGAVAVGQVAYRATEAGAKIRDLGTGPDRRGRRQRIGRGDASIVILIVWPEFLRRDAIEMATRRA